MFALYGLAWSFMALYGLFMALCNRISSFLAVTDPNSFGLVKKMFCISEFLAIGGDSTSDVILINPDGSECTPSTLPTNISSPITFVTSNRLLVCGQSDDGVAFQCYIRSSMDQWESFGPQVSADPAFPYFGVRIPGKGLWFFSPVRSNFSMLYNENTGLWDESFESPWVEDRPNGCAVQIGSKTFYIGGDNDPVS